MSNFERTKTRAHRRRHRAAPARAGDRQRRSGRARRGPLGAGVPAEDAGAGRQAARRHGPPQDPRRRVDRAPALPAPRPAAPVPAAAVDGRDAEPGRGRRTGRPAVRAVRPGVLREGPDRREDRLEGRPGQPGDLRTRPAASAADRTTTSTSPTSSTGPPRNCSSPPAPPSTATTCSTSPHHTADIFTDRSFELAERGGAGPARPGHGSEQPARAATRSRASRDRRREQVRRARAGEPVGPGVRAGEQHLRLGLEQHGAEQPGRDRDRVRPHQRPSRTATR